MRISVYITVALLLFFYVMQDHTSTEVSLLQFKVSSIILHGLNALFIYRGAMDRYVLFVMIDQALLVTGAQFIHLMRCGRRSNHRLFFNVNVAFTLVEFVCAYCRLFGIDRNLNMCPDMMETVSATQEKRLINTVIVLSVAIIFALLAQIIAPIDKWRNRGMKADPPTQEHTVGFRPRGITWDKAKFSWRKIVYFCLGIGWTIYAIVSMELFTIRYFHAYAAQTQLSSDENSWGMGQIIAVAATGFATCMSLVSWMKANNLLSARMS
jgi:hypothetical protein